MFNGSLFCYILAPRMRDSCTLTGRKGVYDTFTLTQSGRGAVQMSLWQLLLEVLLNRQGERGPGAGGLPSSERGRGLHLRLHRQVAWGSVRLAMHVEPMRDRRGDCQRHHRRRSRLLRKDGWLSYRSRSRSLAKSDSPGLSDPFMIGISE